jgi:cell division protein FtsL
VDTTRGQVSLFSWPRAFQFMKLNESVLVSEKMLATMFAVVVVSLALNLIVAVGNWELYSRVQNVETTLGLQATPQLQRTPSQEIQR